MELALPPLRQRPEDLAPLVERFLEQLATRLGRERRKIGAGALARLARHGWPGNVRELRNVIEQTAVLASGDAIEEEDLRLGESASAAVVLGSAAFAVDPTFSDAKRRATEDFERAYLLRALRAHGGNVSRTAESIGMVRQSLQQKIRELDLRAEDWGSGENDEKER